MECVKQQYAYYRQSLGQSLLAYTNISLKNTAYRPNDIRRLIDEFEKSAMNCNCPNSADVRWIL